MKTIRVREFGGPEVMKLGELPDPKPGPGQVVVRVKAVGVNPVDTYIRSGRYTRLPALPYTPGMDAAGVIESVGSDVKNLTVGEKVYTSGATTGTYAELALCEVSQVHPLPENITFAQGAAVNVPYATAYRGLFHRAQARAGETVLVNGASGGVGTAAVQIARAAGMRVIGTGGTEEGRRLVREQGAHHVLDHHAPDYMDQLLSLTENRGVDVILEMLANVNLGKDLTVLAPGARVVVIGSRGPVEIDARHTMTRDASILGMSLMNANPRDVSSIHSALFAGLENGTLKPIVGKEMPLTDAARAHQAILEPEPMAKLF